MDKIIIRSTPKITPTKISVPDLDNVKDSTGNPAFSTDQGSEGKAVKRGTMAPIVQIGGSRIPEDMVKSITVWQYDLLPQISLTLIDSDSVFGAGLFPIADLLISIFIRSQNDKLKSLTGDYLITSVSSSVIPGTSITIYTFAGELHVPKINGVFSKSYKNLTSLDALKKIADDLQLGFADNQPQNTNDQMTWLMPNYSYKSFIKHIKRMAYRDDNNFFDCFIDRYYTLNFINVEKMLTREVETEKGLLALEQAAMDTRRVEENPDTTENEVEVSIILNNHPGAKGSELYIEDFSLTGNHGEVLANHSLRKHVHWYEHAGNKDSKKQDTVNFRDHYLEPLQTPKQNDGIAPQTVNIDEFKNAETISRVWMGLDYSNAHKDYKFAHAINSHNLLELKKNQLKVSLNGINTNVLRGSRVAVLIYMTQTAARSAVSARSTIEELAQAEDTADVEEKTANNDGPPRMVVDKQLSGFYYVSAITYSYMDGDFKTEMILAKRNWLLPRPKNDVKF